MGHHHIHSPYYFHATTLSAAFIVVEQCDSCFLGLVVVKHDIMSCAHSKSPVSFDHISYKQGHNSLMWGPSTPCAEPVHRRSLSNPLKSERRSFSGLYRLVHWTSTSILTVRSANAQSQSHPSFVTDAGLNRDKLFIFRIFVAILPPGSALFCLGTSSENLTFMIIWRVEIALRCY